MFPGSVSIRVDVAIKKTLDSSFNATKRNRKKKMAFLASLEIRPR